MKKVENHKLKDRKAAITLYFDKFALYLKEIRQWLLS